MRKIFSLGLGIVIFMVWSGLANAKDPERVSRDDCHLSFLVPNNLEYIEIDGTIVTGNDECYMAFNYTGSVQINSAKHIPAMPEDWRAMTDFSLTVKNISLEENINKIESSINSQQYGLFNLISKEHISLSGGDLYILTYSAAKPTKDMIKLRESKETVFVMGNGDRSISFPLYSGDPPTKLEKRKEVIFRNLFSSFRFF